MGPLLLGLLCLWGEESVVVTDTEEIASTELQSGETHLLGDIYFSKHLKGCIFYFFFLSNTIVSHFSVYIVCSVRPPKPLTLMFRIHLNLLFVPSYVTLNTFPCLADETFSSVWFPLCVSNMSRGKPCTSTVMEMISISVMKAMWQSNTSYCSGEELDIRAETRRWRHALIGCI